jgi:hypothetical protein
MSLLFRGEPFHRPSDGQPALERRRRTAQSDDDDKEDEAGGSTFGSLWAGFAPFSSSPAVCLG